MVEQLQNTPHQKLHVVMGMVKDKHIDAILKLWPSDARYYFCQAKIPRALDAYSLSEKAAVAGLTGVVIPDVNEAIATAKQHAEPEDLIFIGGSSFVVAVIEGL